MPRKRVASASGRTILFVDDSDEYLIACARVVERDGHQVLTARNGAEGLSILRTCRVDVVFVDYFMPGMNGEEFVTKLRAFDPVVQVILQTGYASERPPRDMLRRLDIQGYHDKSDGPDKLAVWIDVGLKAAFTTQLLEKSRLGLSYILGVTPELHRIQALDDLLQGVLVQASGLLGAVDSFVAIRGAHEPASSGSGFLMTVRRGGGLEVHAGTGRYQGAKDLDAMTLPVGNDALAAALEHESPTLVEQGTIVPLRVGAHVIGLIYLDRAVLVKPDLELLTVFANQAAVAIQNNTLYELAAIDELTRAYNRRFFDLALEREIRVSQRQRRETALLFVDVDDMKSINDGHGHAHGDAALVAVAAMLKRCTRAGDIVGRYGGDEFVVILPDTGADGAKVVAHRIATEARNLRVEIPSGAHVAIAVTIGGAALTAPREAVASAVDTPSVQRTAGRLIQAADAGLYGGKRSGKACASAIATVEWEGVSAAAPLPATARTLSSGPP